MHTVPKLAMYLYNYYVWMFTNMFVVALLVDAGEAPITILSPNSNWCQSSLGKKNYLYQNRIEPLIWLNFHQSLCSVNTMNWKLIITICRWITPSHVCILHTITPSIINLSLAQSICSANFPRSEFNHFWSRINSWAEYCLV